MRRLTAAEVQAKIDTHGRGIIMIGNYAGNAIKTQFQGACGHEWLTIPGSVMRGSGCPYCARNAPVDVNTFRERLAKRGIYVIGNYINSQIKTRFRCAEGHEWDTKPYSVAQGHGCPHCRRISAKEVHALIIDRGIELIGECTGSSTKAFFRCANGHEWYALPYHVMRGRGCPHCSGRVPLTVEIVQARLDADGRGITLIGDYVNANAKTRFRCAEGHEWEAKPGHIADGSGCPKCAGYGIHGKDRAFIYVMDYDNRYTKIGITVNPSRRLRELTLATSHAVELVALYEAGTGRDAYDTEQTIHRRLRAFSAGLSGFQGASELFHVKPETACRLIRKLGGIPAAAEAIIAE